MIFRKPNWFVYESDLKATLTTTNWKNGSYMRSHLYLSDNVCIILLFVKLNTKRAYDGLILQWCSKNVLSLRSLLTWPNLFQMIFFRYRNCFHFKRKCVSCIRIRSKSNKIAQHAFVREFHTNHQLQYRFEDDSKISVEGIWAKPKDLDDQHYLVKSLFTKPTCVWIPQSRFLFC